MFVCIFSLTLLLRLITRYCPDSVEIIITYRLHISLPFISQSILKFGMYPSRTLDRACEPVETKQVKNIDVVGKNIDIVGKDK